MADLPTIFVIDQCRDTRHAIGEILTAGGYAVLAFAALPDFLREDVDTNASCIIADTTDDGSAPPLSMRDLIRRCAGLPVIALASRANVSLVVETMKAGAIDFLEKPVDEVGLLESVARAIEIGHGAKGMVLQAKAAREAIAGLTPREKEVLRELVAGHSNKNVAAALGISARTVEIHRARIMSKTNARSFSGLVRLAFAAAKIDHAVGETAIAA